MIHLTTAREISAFNYNFLQDWMEEWDVREGILLEDRLSGRRPSRAIVAVPAIGPWQASQGIPDAEADSGHECPCGECRDYATRFDGICSECGYDATYCSDRKICESRWDAEDLAQALVLLAPDAERVVADFRDAQRTELEWAWADVEHWLAGGQLS
jgi:hypothetical protein